MRTLLFDYPPEAWPAAPVLKAAPFMESLGWEVVAESDKPDLILCHQDRLEANLVRGPVVVLERCDGCRITGITRKHLGDVRMVLKNSRYADLSMYNRTTGRAFAEPWKEPREPISETDLKKISLGFSYAATERVMGPAPQIADWKPHRSFRASFAGTVTYAESPLITSHRQTCCETLEKLPGCMAVAGRNLSPEEYWDMLADTGCAVSPCGCGEVCWRDYQGILAGCTLIRPDLGYFVETPECLYNTVTFHCSPDWSNLGDVIEAAESAAGILSGAKKTLAQHIRASNTPEAIAQKLAAAFEEAAV